MFPNSDSRVGASKCCQTFDYLPGQRIEITRASDQSHGILKDFPSNQPLWFDCCNSHDRLKLVSPECSFFVYSSQLDLQEVWPLITLLRQRNIMVVREVERNSSVTIINLLQKSFYHNDGSLIHPCFADEKISPKTMAEAGFIFCGDKDSDSVRCYFERSVEISNWASYSQRGITPEHAHQLRCSCMSFKKPRFSLPFVVSRFGEDLTGKAYRLMGNNECQLDCREIVVLSHSHCTLKQIGACEFMSHIDRIRLEDINQAIDYKATIRLKDREYYDQLQKSLILTHFTDPLRQFGLSIGQYTELLEVVKTALPEDRYYQVKMITESMLLLVNIEVAETLKKLVNLEKSELDSVVLDYLDDHLLTAGRQAMTKCANDALAQLARNYVTRFFLDDTLNDLLFHEQLTRGLSAVPFDSRKIKQTLGLLAAKGFELNQLLRDISQRIRALLKPFLFEQQTLPDTQTGSCQGELVTPPRHAPLVVPEYQPSGLLAEHPQHGP